MESYQSNSWFSLTFEPLFHKTIRSCPSLFTLTICFIQIQFKYLELCQFDYGDWYSTPAQNSVSLKLIQRQTLNFVIKVWCTEIARILRTVVQTGVNLAVWSSNWYYYIWYILFFEKLKTRGDSREFSFWENSVFQALKINLNWAKTIIFCSKPI